MAQCTRKMTSSLFFVQVYFTFVECLAVLFKPLGVHMPKAYNRTRKVCDRHLVNRFTSG